MIITAFSHNQNYLVIFQISSVHFIHPYFSQLSRVLTGINNNCVYFILYSVNPETAPHSELKFIVFYSMLIILFSIFCFNCKEDKPQISMKKCGTMVIVKQECSKCLDGFVWWSQPLVLGGYAAGNIMFSFAAHGRRVYQQTCPGF